MPYDASFPNLGINITNLPRVAFSVFGVPLYVYGLMITFGVLAGLLYARHEAKRTGQDPETYYDFTMYALVLSIIGARVYYVVFSWDTYKDNLWSVFNIREGGLAIYGGIITAVATAVVYSRVKKIPFGLFADTGAPALLLGQTIGRWGNFFNREAYGTPTDSLFALRYLVTSDNYVPPSVLEKAFILEGYTYIQVHPTFLYESVWNLLLFVLLNVYKRHKKFDGEILFLYLFGYGLGRVWIEGLRTDQLLLWGTGIAVSQVLSGVLVVVAAGCIIKGRLASRGTNEHIIED